MPACVRPHVCVCACACTHVHACRFAESAPPCCHGVQCEVEPPPMRRRLVSREAEPVSPPSRRGGSVSVPPARPASGWSPSSRRRVCGGSLWSAIVSERPGSSAPVSAPRAPRRAADLLRRHRRVPLGQGRRREVGLTGSPHPVASDGPHVLAAAPRPADCACRKEPASRGRSSDSGPCPLLTGRAPRASSLASRNVSARCEARAQSCQRHTSTRARAQ